MHELSIALSIVKTATSAVEEVQGASVTDIYLEVGKLSGVELGALRFVWQPCVNGTVLEHARLTVSTPGGKAECLECEQAFAIAQHYDACPYCGSPFKRIVSGKELKIKKLVIT
ncbi:hydrogenase maturation nickel metallochaperone HypA/HybF [Parapedobacter koreensis]|uniref:Hydrogenase maturation factor HypA n=1 Tax=Parapedobacter koreensis TaxID=332977 RepID=A0A1H7TKR2_9SPHI|nr:hydrogenase maturation nickel metallochaperone HypA [Parapedobacter koreensis]SEL85391.1 hydrogenase nickel incorporation protein HypA/HybF [Parapedobacter koreensis]